MDVESKLEGKEKNENEVKVDAVEIDQIEEKFCEIPRQKPQVTAEEEAFINETISELEPKLSDILEDKFTDCDLQIPTDNAAEVEVEVQSRQNEIVDAKNNTEILTMVKHEECTLDSRTIISQSTSLPATPTLSGRILKSTELEVKQQQQDATLFHLECMAQKEQQRVNFEQQLEQLRAALAQKDNMIALFQRENGILEKEKQAVKRIFCRILSLLNVFNWLLSFILVSQGKRNGQQGKGIYCHKICNEGKTVNRCKKREGRG